MPEITKTMVLWPGIGKDQLAAGFGEIAALKLRQVGDFGDFAQALPGTEILAMPSHYFSKQVAQHVHEHGQALRFLQLLTAGYEQLERHGVPTGLVVANASPAMAPAVAEHALGLLLALSRNLSFFVRRQDEGTWVRGDLGSLRSLMGAHFAIVGFGSIGKEVAKRLKAFGAKIIAVSRKAHAHPLADEVILLERLIDALAKADAVVLALPYTPANHHLLNAQTLAACKRGALVVNVARGGLVDTDAIVVALAEGRLGGFATDVAETEPLPVDSPLWSAPNALITPHVAGADGEAGFRRLADFAARNVGRYLSGELPDNIIALRSQTCTIEGAVRCSS